MKSPRINKTLTACGLLALSIGLLPANAPAQTTRERGHGPYLLVTPRGEVMVRLLRRDGDMVWMDRRMDSGEWVETGVPTQRILDLKAPRPREFVRADEIVSNDQIPEVIDELRRLVARLRSFRDLPGIPVHEALMLQASLNERRSFWREALNTYQEILDQPGETADHLLIQYRAGICLWHLEEFEKALAFLLINPVPEEELNLWSEVMFARADCLAQVERHREAVDAFLPMVVFHPFAQTNEARALSAIIPSFIALGDWDAAMKSFEALQADYPDAPETTAANELLAQYTGEVAAEQVFDINEE